MKINVKKKEKGILSGYELPIMLFVFVMVYAISSYGIKMDRKIRQQVYDSYIQELNSVTEIYDKELYAVKKVADLVAEQLSGNGADIVLEDAAEETEDQNTKANAKADSRAKDETEDEAGAEDNLFSAENIRLARNATEVFKTCNVYLVKNDYSGVDINGNIYESMKDVPGFSDAISELDSYSKLVEDVDGNKTFLVVSTISDDISLTGYVVIEYRPDIMDTLTSDPRFSMNKTFALVTSDGDVIEMCGTPSDLFNKGKNILDNSDATYNDGSYTTFKQGISNSRTGHVRIIKGGEDKDILYGPISNYFASVVMVIEHTDMQVSIKAAMHDVKTFLVTCGIIIGVIVLIVIGIGILNRTKHNMESEDLQYKADTDQLTDLYNKSATERLIKEYLEGDGKDKVSMMFVLDIDNFKKINDTQGHAFGDKVLSSLGHQIRSWFRVNDIIGRIGGDEFIIFVKDIKNPDAIKREGSRIMQFFEGFNVGDYTRYSPTASVGGAVFPNDADSFETLYKAADKAVYKSKHEGKNRVSFYGDLDSAERQVIGNSEDPESRQGD